MIAIPGEIAVEAATTLLPLGNTTATHCVLSTEKARTELGYEPVVSPDEALAEVVGWYGADRTVDPGSTPALTDRFDYQTEDAVIAAYAAAVAGIAATVEQHPQPPVHSMAHPKAPGGPDHRGR
jgi:hypothetical protein